MRHLLILLIFLSGCMTDSSIIKTQKINSLEAIKIEKEIQEREKIFKVYDKNIPNLTILAYEKIHNNTFDIAKNYLQYDKETDNPTYDGFWVWLIKNYWYKDMFDKGDEFGIGKRIIDNRFDDKEYVEIKKNYELLEKMK